jgi:uncharacterized protein (DUF1330 family)
LGCAHVNYKARIAAQIRLNHVEITGAEPVVLLAAAPQRHSQIRWDLPRSAPVPPSAGDFFGTCLSTVTHFQGPQRTVVEFAMTTTRQDVSQAHSNTPYYIVFDVHVWDADRYREFMERVRPALEAVGGRYLARGGESTVYEGDWQPRRIVLLEFPSQEAFESFYYGSTYTEVRKARDESSSARVVGVVGVNGASGQTR